MMIMAIDPGPEYSAWIRYSPTEPRLVAFDHQANVAVLTQIKNLIKQPDRPIALAIEMVRGYGMPVGKEVFETCVWIGRFIQQLDCEQLTHRYDRKQVVRHFCGTDRAKDANVRQAMLDRFGPGKQLAVGTKKAPGPLYGVSGDVWSALAIACVHADKYAGP